MAPVYSELCKYPHFFNPITISTGQHRELLNQTLRDFNFPVHYDLNVMTPGQSLSELSSKIMTRLDCLFKKTAPDFTLIQGDTTSALMGGLVSFYSKIPLGHIEAGLRTSTVDNPFPEEAQRRIITQIATYHFAPTNLAKENLHKELGELPNIIVTGNTIIDALINLRVEAPDRRRPYILVTIHRRENFSKLNDICNAIKILTDDHPDFDFIFPVHLNPVVRKIVYEQLGGIPNISLVEPMDYKSFISHMKGAQLIITDSGGVQEEAPALGIPAVIIRENTERPEGLETGFIKLAGTTTKNIIITANELLQQKQGTPTNLYGDGHAAEKIIQELLKYFQIII